MEYVRPSNTAEGKSVFPELENEVYDLWSSEDTFKVQVEAIKGLPTFTFYDGPPFCTGTPHYGHLLAGTVKDVICRYKVATGFDVQRHAGWDTHGLPIEHLINTKYNYTTRDSVLEAGIATYNAQCREVVMNCESQWRDVVTRSGRWIDFDNAYTTMDHSYMNSVWSVFKRLNELGRVYQGVRVMPYSLGCTTPLSNFEAGEAYADVEDPAIFVTFPVTGDATLGGRVPEGNVELTAWTTTPWTLPSNLALCVNPAMKYDVVRDIESGRVLVICQARVDALFGAWRGYKPAKGKKAKKPVEKPYEVICTLEGKDLVETRYEPLYDFFQGYAAKYNAHRVIAGDFVTDADGTGIVHLAPFFGEDDYQVCHAAGILKPGGDVVCPIDDSGYLTAECGQFTGMRVKKILDEDISADKAIITDLQERSRCLSVALHKHSYPHCWRSKTPLIYRAVPSWFISINDEDRALMVEQLAETHWVPQKVRDGRFKKWLENARDWNVSRNRFWGTPLPIWRSPEEPDYFIVVGSARELEKLAGLEAGSVVDIHRDNVDHIKIADPRGPKTLADGTTIERAPLERVEEVADCWLDSGAMPYAREGFLFEDGGLEPSMFPADFIAEGLDQTRGWFYTLTVLGCALLGRIPFRNLIVFGLILAEDGTKMSKSLKNYTDPMEIVHQHTADALRMYLINSPAVRAEPLQFSDDDVKGVVRSVLMPWYSVYRFFYQQIERHIRTSDKTEIKLNANVKDCATHILDKWLLNKLSVVIQDITKEMDAYCLYRVLPVFVDFIDSLSKVYIRLSRQRLKGREGEDAAFNSLCVLHHVLLKLSTIAAPFMPFLSDHMFRNLLKIEPSPESYALVGTDVPTSVHLAKFPAANPEHIFEEASRQVDVALQCIELGRRTREHARLGLAQPLSSMTFAHYSPQVVDDIKAVSELLSKELKVVSVEATTNERDFAELSLQPNHRALGRRCQKQRNAVVKAIETMSYEDACAIRNGGEIDVLGFPISLEGHIPDRDGSMQPDVTITLEPRATQKEGEVTLIGGDNNALVASVTPELTEDLVEEGRALRLAAMVQQCRKAAGYEPGEDATVLVRAEECLSSAVTPAFRAKLKRDSACELNMLDEATYAELSEVFEALEPGKDATSTPTHVIRRVTRTWPGMEPEEEAILALPRK